MSIIPSWGLRTLATVLVALGLTLPPAMCEAALRKPAKVAKADRAEAPAKPRAKATARAKAKKTNQQKRQARKADVPRRVPAVTDRVARDSNAWATRPSALVPAAAAAGLATASFDAASTPAPAAQAIDPAYLHSQAVLVIDRDTNAVLVGKNDAAVLPIASLTKLMTGLVIADANLPMDEVLTITEDDVDRIKGSGSRLAVGTRLTRGEALHLALMASENRAAHALGRTYPGGVGAFVMAMNRKAAEIGMTQTRFVEPTGLSPDNRSSPRDVARLVAAAAERPMLRELSTAPSYELASGRRVVQYRNSNKLVRESSWDILLQKTGYIREAGRCVAMQVRLAGRNLIMVLMDAADSSARWTDAERLLHWLEQSLPQGQGRVGV